MKSPADWLRGMWRPEPPRPIESTRTELAREIVKRRRIHSRTAHLAVLLADYRRQDGILK